MYVYLIKCSIFYKIGFSKNPNSRLNTIKTHNPLEVVLFATLKTDNYLILEKELHNLFLNKNTKREWFELNEDDLIKLKTEYGFNFILPINSSKNNLSIKKDDFTEIKNIRIDNNKIDYFSNYFEELYNCKIKNLKELKKCCIGFDESIIKEAINSLYSQDTEAQNAYNLLYKVCGNIDQLRKNPKAHVIKIISAIVYKQYNRKINEKEADYIEANYDLDLDHNSVIKDLNTKKFYVNYNNFIEYVIDKYTI